MVQGIGKQYMSWVAIDDVIGAIYHALVNESLKGPTNVTSPHPVTNDEFTKILGSVLKEANYHANACFCSKACFRSDGRRASPFKYKSRTQKTHIFRI